MGDAGLKSLAEAIMTGAFVDCSRLNISGVFGLINVIPFTNGLRSGGLKSLRVFKFQSNEIEPHGITLLAHTLLEHCPILLDVYLPIAEPDTQRFIRDL